MLERFVLWQVRQFARLIKPTPRRYSEREMAWINRGMMAFAVLLAAGLVAVLADAMLS